MKVVIGITGASGSIYAKRLIEELITRDHDVVVVASKHGQQVFEYELKQSLEAFITGLDSNIILADNEDMFDPIASGSHRYDAVVIAPCSMASLAAINTGNANTLLLRCCDVALKERRELILLTRESPLSSIHLKNMYELSTYGVRIIPASPGFYHHPQSLDDVYDFVVSKLLDALKIENDLYKRWRD